MRTTLWSWFANGQAIGRRADAVPAFARSSWLLQSCDNPLLHKGVLFRLTLVTLGNQDMIQGYWVKCRGLTALSRTIDYHILITNNLD